MAWIKPYRYWYIMSNPDYYAYQLEDGGKVIINEPTEFHLNKPPGKYKEKTTTVLQMKRKYKAFYYSGEYDAQKNNLQYVDVGVPLAWCVAKRRGLDILRDAYDRQVAATYKHCKQ